MSDNPLSPVERVILETQDSILVEFLVTADHPSRITEYQERREQIRALLSAPDEPEQLNNQSCPKGHGMLDEHGGCAECLRLEQQPVEQEPDTGGQITDAELRKRWKDAGGRFHGPTIETGTMPEEKLLPFLRGLYTPTEQPIEQQITAEQWLSDNCTRLIGPGLLPTPEQPSGEDDQRFRDFCRGNPYDASRCISNLIAERDDLEREFESEQQSHAKTYQLQRNAERQLEALQAKYSELEGLVVEYRDGHESIQGPDLLDALFAFVTHSHTEARGDG